MSTTIKDLFLTRSQHIQVRTCGKLLCALDNVLDRERGLSASLTMPNAAHPGLFRYILNTHCNILVRRYEVVAVVLSGKRSSLATGPDDGVGNIIDPTIVIAANPRPDDYNKTRTQDKDEKKVIVTQIDISNTVAPQTMIADLLQSMCNAKEDITNSSNTIPFADHVRTYFGLLRAVHAASDLTEHGNAVAVLRDYVYATSFPKMIMRFDNGAKEARDNSIINFLDIVMRTDNFPEHASRIQMPVHLLSKRPSPAQAKLIAIALEGMGADYIKTWQEANIYDTPVDRIRFQSLLQDYLSQAKRACEELQQTMDRAVNSICGSPAAERPGKLAIEQAKVQLAVQSARQRMSLLVTFLDNFKDFLGEHLKWLAEAANVEDFRSPPIWTEPRSTTAGSATPNPVPPEHGSSSEQKPHINDLEEEREEEDSDLSDLYALQEALHMSQQQRTSKYRVWAIMCQSWMELPGLPEISLRRATVGRPGLKSLREKHESALIQTAQVGLVNISIKCWDHECAKIDAKFIESLLGHQPDLDVARMAKKLKDKERIGVNKLERSMVVAGAPHCEAILMSLIAIAKDESIMKHITDDWLEHNGIFATRKDLLEMFPDVLPMVHVSKKCCPACEKVRAQMQRVGITTNDFVAPGSHAKYAGFLLPSFIPKRLGQPVLESIERDAAEKLMAWQKKLQSDDFSKALGNSKSPQSEINSSPSEYAEVPIEAPVSTKLRKETQEHFSVTPSRGEPNPGDISMGDASSTGTQSSPTAQSSPLAPSSPTKIQRPRDFTDPRQPDTKKRVVEAQPEESGEKQEEQGDESVEGEKDGENES
ncbi:hypothetical protein CLAFUR0_14614 [Fulvia fulva]|nr:hypothetical protein CLAFUR0_14614 [Fulvia fulva]